MLKPSDKLWDVLYLCGAIITQSAAVHQIYKIHITESASDFSMIWLIALLFGETLHLPRCLTSQYWVWKVAHVSAIILITILLISYLRFR